MSLGGFKEHAWSSAGFFPVSADDYNTSENWIHGSWTSLTQSEQGLFNRYSSKVD